MIEINISNNYSSTIELNNELINKGSLRANEFFITAEFATTYEELTRYVCTFNFRRNDNVEINGLVATPVKRNSKWGWFYNISSKDITALDGDLHLTIKLNNLNEEEVITTTSFTLHVERNEFEEEIVLINDAQYNALLDKFNLYYTKDIVESLVDQANNKAQEANNKAQGAYDFILENYGGPKETYASLSALQTAYPNGASGVYLTSDNGHWYYWNGSAWTNGGVYQSSEDVKQIKEDLVKLKSDDGIKGNQISSEKFEIFSSDLTNNWVDGKYITAGNAEEIVYDGFSYGTAQICPDDEYVEISGFYANPLLNEGNFVVFTNGSTVIHELNVFPYYTFELVDLETLTFRIKVPNGAKNVKYNVNTKDKDKAYCKSIKTDGTKKLEWLEIDVDSIPDTYDKEKRIYARDMPLTSYKFWMMDGSLYTANELFRCTETIYIPSGTEIKVFPYYKKGKNGNAANGAFVDSNGKFVRVIGDYAEGETDYITLTVPSDAVGIQLNYTNESESVNNISSSLIYVEFNSTKKYFEWMDIHSSNINDSELMLMKKRMNNEPQVKTSIYKYGDSLLKPFDFSGKSLVAFGDSITAGVANEGSGNISAYEDAYIRRFSTYVGAILTNNAVSGSTITFVDNESITSIYTKVTSYSNEADYIIISGGTNDYNQGRTLGEYGDNTKYTFYGSLKLICEYLKTNYPNTKVIFITPINVTKDFNGHDRKLLNDYRNAIYEVATSYEYSVVNGIDLIPATLQSGWDNEMINKNDGCHPTIKGHRLYARNLCGKLL